MVRKDLSKKLMFVAVTEKISKILPLCGKNSCLNLVAQSPYPRSHCQLRYLRLVMNRTNIMELHINKDNVKICV